MSDYIPAYDYNGLCPSDQIDPALKDKDWVMMRTKYAYGRNQSSVFMNNARRNDWIINEQYADGNQNTSKYKNWLSKLKSDGKGNVPKGETISYMDLDYSIVSTIPKMEDVVLEYWNKLDYDVYCDAINPAATQDRKFFEAFLKTKLVLKEFNAMVDEALGKNPQAQESDFMPQDMDEIQIFLQDGFRLPYEMEMELGIQMCKEESDWKEIRKRIRKDFFRKACGACKVYIDRITGKPKVRYVNPINCILEDFEGHDGDAMNGFGEVIAMTIADIRLDAGDQFTEEDYYNIAKLNCGMYGNPDEMLPWSDYINTDVQYTMWRNYDSFKIKVLDYEFNSSDRIKQARSEKYSKDSPNYYRRPYSEPEGIKKKKAKDGTIYDEEVKAIDIKTIYGCMWIIGSNFCYNAGKKANIARPNENKKECYREFKFWRVSNKSMIERLIPLADSIALTYLKIQNMKARMVNMGLMIEHGSFENMTLDGADFKAKQAIETGFQTGIWIYKRNSAFDSDGSKTAVADPVKEIGGGAWNEILTAWQEIDVNIQKMRDISGINEVMDATVPNPKLAVGIANISLTAANNAISPLIEAFVSMEEKISYMIMLKIQVACRLGKLTGWVKALGSVFPQMIELGDDLSPLSYGIRVVARPTADEKQAILTVADKCLNNANPSEDSIEAPDYFMIRRMVMNGTNLKVVEMILASRIAKNKKAKQQTQQMIAQQTASAQTQGAIQLEQAKMTTIQAKGEEDRKTAEVQGMWAVKAIQAKATTLQDQSIIDGAIDKEIAYHQHQLDLIMAAKQNAKANQTQPQ